MELRVLNYFLMVAREENITRAANLLHVTQPTLSRQLMQLEEELGTKLFERGSHRIVLTEDGHLLKRRAQEIVSLVDKTQNEFSREDELSGEISIGGGESAGMTFLAQIMSRFHALHPDVQFHIYTGIADHVKEQLESGNLDMGMLVEPVDISQYSFCRLPDKDRWGLVVREDSPIAEKEYITPQDLSGRPVIASGRSIVRNELTSWMGEHADTLNVVATMNLMYNGCMMVKAGLGDMVALDLEAHYDGLKFIPFYPDIYLGSVLVWKKNKTMSALIKKFLRFCKEEILRGEKSEA